MIAYFFLATGLLAAFVLAAVTIAFIRQQSSVDIFRRLRRHHVEENIRVREDEDIVRRIYLKVKQLAQPIADWNVSKKLDFLLKQAGVPIYGGEFIIISIVLAIAAFFITYIVTFNINYAPLAAISMPFLMFLMIRIRVGKRRQAFTEQLGDCLTTVSNALRAGYSFQQAMDVVAKEMEPPMSTEFERVTADVAMGVALEDALQQMNKRLDSSDFDLVVTAVLIQREIGGNLAQILDTISETINERIRMKREISALTAQGRFSAWVLLLLPFAVGAFCWFFNNEQMQVFVNEESGRIALAVSFIMEIIGFFVIQKIVDIET